MNSNLQVIGNIRKGVPTVLVIAGSMIDPCVYDQIIVPPLYQVGKVDFYHSPGPYDVTSIASRIMAYSQEMELNTLVLVGYSAGGVIALSAAVQSPDRVGGLLLSNTGPCTVGHGDPELPQKMLKQWDDPEFRESFIKRCFAGTVPPLLQQRLMAYIDTIDRQAAYELSLSLRKVDLRTDLGRIRCPVVIAHGIDDKARPEAHAHMICEGIPQAKLHLIPGGHTIMVENKADWQSSLDELLQMVTEKMAT